MPACAFSMHQLLLIKYSKTPLYPPALPFALNCAEEKPDLNSHLYGNANCLTALLFAARIFNLHHDCLFKQDNSYSKRKKTRQFLVSSLT